MKRTQQIFAALVGLTVLAGCQMKEEPVETLREEPMEKPAEVYTLTLQASKGTETKALSLDTSGEKDRLNAHWRTGEQVAVYLGGTLLGMLSAEADANNATKATLSGTFTTVAGVNQGSELMLLFPRAEWDYTGQDGSVPDETGPLATQYDYATATVTVATVDTEHKIITTTSGANFENQQSMYRFGFKEYVTEETIPIKGFTVRSENAHFVRRRFWSGSDWTEDYGPISVNVTSGTLSLPYASLRNTIVNPSAENDSYSFAVIGADDALYLGRKTIPSSVLTEQGKFISAKGVVVRQAIVPDNNNTTTEVW